MKKATVLLLSVLLMLSAASGLAGVDPEKLAKHPGSSSKTYMYVENSLVRVMVEDSYAGAFCIGTSSQHATPCKPLTFYGYCDQSSDTSSIIISIDGTTYHLFDSSQWYCTPGMVHTGSTVYSNRIESTFVLTDVTPTPTYAPSLAEPPVPEKAKALPITVRVVHTPVLFSSTVGAILTETYVTNNDSAPHSIGVLYQYDTMVGENDAADMAAGGMWYPNETCFDNPTFNYWEAFENTFPPAPTDLVGRGTISGGSAVRPDRLALGQWGYFYDVCWDYTCSGLEFSDSSMLAWWYPQAVAAGGTRRVATYYGLGEVTTTPGELSLSLSYTSELTCTTSGLSPNPFGISAYVTNTGESICDGVTATLSLGSGLTTTSSLVVDLSSVASGETEQAYWSVRATGSPCGLTIPFTVNVGSSSCDANSGSGSVIVPCCPTPTPAPVPATNAAGAIVLLAIMSLFAWWAIHRRG